MKKISNIESVMGHMFGTLLLERGRAVRHPPASPVGSTHIEVCWIYALVPNRGHVQTPLDPSAITGN